METLVIPPDIFDAMVAYCKSGYPNEMCGILAGKGNRISKLYTMSNIEPSPVSYLMEPKEQFIAMKDMRENNLSMIAIFHSHPASVPYPSQKDIGLAFYDDCAYVIVGLSGQAPLVKAFAIQEGKTKELAVTVA